MIERNPYSVIKYRHVTEKARVLEGLQHATSNASILKCQTPKYIFIVDDRANKQEIAWAVEKIYANKNVKVTGVNIINIKPKKRRVRGHEGKKAGFKKAIVSLEAGDAIDEQV